MLDTVLECQDLINNFHYGFPTKLTHTDQDFAVPYSAVGTPIKNSNFSDIDMVFVLTIFSYYQYKEVLKFANHLFKYNPFVIIN